VALEDLFGDFLAKYPGPTYESFSADTDRGFVSVETKHFNGVIQWSGDLAATKLVLHNVGESSELANAEKALLIDLPGHGLSGDISEAATLADWAEVIAAAIKNLGAANIECIEGDQLSALLALAIAKSIGADCVCATNAHIPVDGDKWQAAQPDLTPDRFGSHLNKAWQIVRASQFFWPWFEAKNANVIKFEKEQIDPEYLALAHRALLRARSREHLTKLLLGADKSQLVASAPKISNWQLASWSINRTDIWRP
jgi:pimeloyl-ACP methyl ester carboxylesterase